eukprot:GHVS01049671.1.p1 GENE.GHVS01049671.1~~GHVS01049671.1.p1  ORF type:complete len:109 (-),score=0.36 GHVS01049671.1:20-346(-)
MCFRLNLTPLRLSGTVTVEVKEICTLSLSFRSAFVNTVVTVKRSTSVVIGFFVSDSLEKRLLLWVYQRAVYFLPKCLYNMLPERNLQLIQVGDIRHPLEILLVRPCQR